MTAYDVIVVGLGGMGSATAAALARRGQRVLGLDRHRAVHDQGASHGETRIVRTAYFEGAAHVPLLHRACELWDELGLLTRTGGLFLGEEGSRVLGGSLATARQWGLPHELLDSPEVPARFPDGPRRPAPRRSSRPRPASSRRWQRCTSSSSAPRRRAPTCATRSR